jgi:gamma-glutamylcyclotransferase (GGCT)/AIG2-like uncharacterized protein YtfP
MALALLVFKYLKVLKMNNKITNSPYFSSGVLPYLNSRKSFKKLNQARDLLGALEKIIIIYRKVNEDRSENNDSRRDTNLQILKKIVKGFSNDEKIDFLGSKELKQIVDINPPIEDMSTFTFQEIWPEDAYSDLKMQAQKKHMELKEAYVKYVERNSGQTDLIKKLCNLIMVVRNNISHGEKTPMGPDKNFNKRNQAILDAFIPFLRNIFFELLFDYPKKRICLYGTLKSGNSNHNYLKEIVEDDLKIKKGFIEGKVYYENNKPFFKPVIPGEKIDVEILEMNNPDKVTRKLIEFEGPDYKLMLIVAEIDGKKNISSIFGKNNDDTEYW